MAIAERDISLTFLKGMTVLQAFNDAGPAPSLADIARITGYDRAVVRRLILTLVELGYVERTESRFRLTPRVLVLGGGFLRTNDFGRLVQPVLNICASEMGHAVALAMVDGDHAVYVAQSTLQNSRFTFGFTVGSRLPLLQTSIGRMLMAWGDPDWAERVLETAPLAPVTRATETDRARIRAAVETTAEQGFSLVRDEFEDGIAGLSVPIGIRGTTRAALGLSEPNEELTPDEIPRLIASLRRCAGQLRPGFSAPTSEPFG